MAEMVEIVSPLIEVPIYLKTDQDGTLLIKSVHAIVGDVGLCYADSVTHQTADVKTHPQEEVFLKPEGGWQGKKFIAVASNYADDYQRKETSKLLYTISGTDCVTAVKRNYAVTYSHGSHASLQKDHTVLLRSIAEPQKICQAIVLHANEAMDFGVLKTTEELCEREPIYVTADTRLGYFQAGISNGLPTYNSGFIFSKALVSYDFLRGTCGSVKGESGCGCFTKAGEILGIGVGSYKGVPKICEKTPTTEAIKQLQVTGRYACQTMIVPIYSIQVYIAEDQHKSGKPEQPDDTPND